MDTREQFKTAYFETTKKVSHTKRDVIDVSCTFVDGPKVEITGTTVNDYNYIIKFWDGAFKVVHQHTLKINRWCTCSRQWYTDWRITVEVEETGELIHEHTFDLTGKKVVIDFQSSSMGDTLSWLPYVEEFRKKHNCEILVWTFHSEWFDKDKYSELYFLDNGESWSNVYARYYLGLFCGDQPEGNDNFVWDEHKNPVNPFTIPQQQIATDILGLEYEELWPHLKYDESPIRKRKRKYVCIAIQSTAQCKYWNWPNGWNKIVKYIKEKLNYEVVCIDRDNVYGGMGMSNKMPNGAVDETGNKPLEERMRMLRHAEFFIGTGSGLSWLAWAIGTPTILISSFSKPFTEFQNNVIRLYNDNEHSGYYNTGTFNKSNWNWNPNKECKTIKDWAEVETITPAQVRDAINKICDRPDVTKVKTGDIVEERQYPDELSYTAPKEKIGMLFMPYNCHNTFPKWVKPWVRAKEKHDLTIGVASNLFKGYADLGFTDECNKETLKLLRNDYKDFVDYLWTGTPRTDAETRNMVLYWMLEQDIDIIWCVDSDEWFTDEEIDYTMDYVRTHSQETFFEIQYKNYLDDNSKYYDYKAGRIYRLKRFEQCWFYMDTHMHYEGIRKLYTPLSPIGDYRCLPGLTVPIEYVNPKHYSWNDDRKDDYQPGTNKDRIDYQKIAYGDGSSWGWDEEKDKLIKVDHTFWKEVDIHNE